jgi:hypothetical protein
VVKTYRGFEVKVTREMCLGGWKQAYFSIYRSCDGLCVAEDHTEATDPVYFLMALMLGRVDSFIETKGASECPEEHWEPTRGTWLDTKQRPTKKAAALIARYS